MNIRSKEFKKVSNETRFVSYRAVDLARGIIEVRNRHLSEESLPEAGGWPDETEFI